MDSSAMTLAVALCDLTPDELTDLQYDVPVLELPYNINIGEALMAAERWLTQESLGDALAIASNHMVI